MRTEPLKGRRGYWLRQFSDTAEGTLDRILDTLTQIGGGDCLCLKVADGTTWQGVIDPSTPVRMVEDIVALKGLCEARGVSFLPVVVPRGRNVAAEAAMHGEIARAAGCLMTDIEPYDQFFDGGDGRFDPVDYTNILAYAGALRVAAGDAYLINQPDPRGWAARDGRVEETAQFYDGIAAQHYVGWASVGWVGVQEEVSRFEQMARHGRDMYVTLYGVERTDLAAAFWEQVRGRCLGDNVFALGPMNATQLRHFAALPKAGGSVPQPQPDPKPGPQPDPNPGPGPQPDIVRQSLGTLWQSVAELQKTDEGLKWAIDQVDAKVDVKTGELEHDLEALRNGMAAMQAELSRLVTAGDATKEQIEALRGEVELLKASRCFDDPLRRILIAFTSKKFAAVLAGITLTATQMFRGEVPPEVAIPAIITAVIGYLVAEGYIDAKRVLKGSGGGNGQA